MINKMKTNMKKKLMFGKAIEDLERSGNMKNHKDTCKPVKPKVNKSIARFSSFTNQAARDFNCLLTMKFFKLSHERIKIVISIRMFV